MNGYLIGAVVFLGVALGLTSSYRIKVVSPAGKAAERCSHVPENEVDAWEVCYLEERRKNELRAWRERIER